ncbi:MAG: M55 family metallopeptidase [Oscillospiraceae bacterium]|nr:M55 family metallopeptidase [Oscillospiraceae bacterium]
MNVLVMTDLEGITNVDSIDMIPAENPGYLIACENLMADINAAIEGLCEAGAETIYVIDGHGGGNNFIPDTLDGRAVLLKYPEWENAVRNGKIDAFIEIGAHAMAGTQNAFLDHTQNSKKWFDYSVNGRPSGEIAQGAIFAAAYGVPFVMLSGDTAVCEEARRFFGDIECAAVKQATGRNKARSLPADEARSIIRNCAKRSLALTGKIKLYKPLLPLELIFTFQRCDYCDEYESRPGLERTGPRTLRKLVNKVERYTDILL